MVMAVREEQIWSSSCWIRSSSCLSRERAWDRDFASAVDLDKPAPRERVVDSKKVVPEKKPNLETMAPLPGMFDVFLNHAAAAAIGFFIVAFSTILFAGHFSAR